FASSTASAPVTPSTAGRRGSRRRRGRSARASPPASAWRSRRSGWPAISTVRASRCSITTSTRSPGTAAGWPPARARPPRSPGAEHIRLTKRNSGWPQDARFLVPDGGREHLAGGVGARGHAAREAWLAKFEAYRATYPELADHRFKMQHRRLPDGWDKGLAPFAADPKGVAGRDASAKVLNILAQNTPWLIGGAADLAPSTKTRLTFEGAGDFTAAHPEGRNFHFGIREHAMGSILHGLSLSKVRAYGSGFLIFSDYMRPAI